MKATYSETSLPLYNEEYVAQLQRFFGLELASQTAANGDAIGDDSAQPEDPSDEMTSGRVEDEDRGTTYIQLKQPRNPPAGKAEERGGDGEREWDDEAANPEITDPRYRYRVRNWFWYGLFSFGAMLGDDYFYFFIFPFSIANFSWWVTRRLLMVWGFCMFIGQASKEILQWPRPREPPVVRLERRYFKEYGMPSTHAVVGTLMPFTLLVSTWNHYEYPKMLGFVLACNWTLLVCCSRLYRGMHFILDLIAGVALTGLLMALIWPWLDTLDRFLLTHPYAPVIVISVTVVLCVLYPTCDGIGATRNDTMSIMGTMSGGLCGFWFNHRNGMVPDAHAPLGGLIKWPDLPAAGVMFARYAVFKSLAMVLFFGTKFLLKKVIHALFGIRVNEQTKRWLSIQLSYGYMPHAFTMMVVYQVGPQACEYLGLDNN